MKTKDRGPEEELESTQLEDIKLKALSQAMDKLDKRSKRTLLNKRLVK